MRVKAAKPSSTLKGSSLPLAAMSWMQVRNWKTVRQMREDQGAKGLVYRSLTSRLWAYSAMLGRMRTQSTPPMVMVSPISTATVPLTSLPLT